MIKLRVAALCILLAPALSAGGERRAGQWPEGPCADAGSSRAMETCEEKLLREAEAEMKRAYDRLSSAMDSTQERARLRASQRAWLKYRQSNCQSEAFLYRGGTIQELIQIRCTSRLTRERHAELEAQFKQYTG